MRLAVDENGNKILKVEKKDFKSGMRTGRPFQVQTNGNLPQTHRMTNETLDTVVALLELESHLERYNLDELLIAFRAINRDAVKAMAVNITPPSKEYLVSKSHIKDVVKTGSQGESYDL